MDIIDFVVIPFYTSLFTVMAVSGYRIVKKSLGKQKYEESQGSSESVSSTESEADDNEDLPLIEMPGKLLEPEDIEPKTEPIATEETTIEGTISAPIDVSTIEEEIAKNDTMIAALVSMIDNDTDFERIEKTTMNGDGESGENGSLAHDGQTEALADRLAAFSMTMHGLVRERHKDNPAMLLLLNKAFETIQKSIDEIDVKEE